MLTYCNHKSIPVKLITLKNRPFSYVFHHIKKISSGSCNKIWLGLQVKLKSYIQWIQIKLNLLNTFRVDLQHKILLQYVQQF